MNHKNKISDNNKSSQAIEDYSHQKDIYPYPVNDDDHCESPFEAYLDLEFLLDFLCAELGKMKSDILIYDPYFCEGKVVENLNKIGFQNVYNRKEDFYANIESGNIPEYDILVTNPPYSENHVEKLLSFCVDSRKPFSLLLPNYVYTKDYFQLYLKRSNIFFLCPTNGRRYLYTTPKGRRQEKSSKYTSPFPTFWYCNLGCFNQKALSTYSKLKPELQKKKIHFAKNITQIPVDIAPDNDPKKKKLRNAQKRKKNKLRKKKSFADTAKN